MVDAASNHISKSVAECFSELSIAAIRFGSR
jgi:hypothetical protein